MSPGRIMTMSKVIRAKPHLTLAEIDERLKNLQDFWRIRRWMIIRHAVVDPAPAKDIALRLGLSVCTVRDLIEAYHRQGPDAIETPGKGQRQHASLSVEDGRTFLAPLLADSQVGHSAVARRIKKALEDARGHPVATSTIYRLLHRYQWRNVMLWSKIFWSSLDVQDTLKKAFQPSSRKSWKPV